MKNRLPFAALTFAFTIAGAAIGFALHGYAAAIPVIGLLAAIGGTAAACCHVQT